MSEERNDEKPIPSLSEVYDKIKAENDRTETLLKRQEELVARGLLGGRTDAGVVAKPPVEESAKDYARRVERGEFNLKK